MGRFARRYLRAVVSMAPVLCCFAAACSERGTKRTDTTTVAAAMPPDSQHTAAAPVAPDWRGYSNDLAAMRYSPLTDITPQNAGSLKPVCTYDLGETAVFQAGPVVVGGTIYVTSDQNTYAIDAATCALRWKRAHPYSPPSALRVDRGVAYVDTPDGPRVVRGAGDGHVFALDANTGAPVWDVGIGDPTRGETVPAAPIAWNGMIFVGQAGGDNFGVTGRMYGLDARTGRQIWMFHLVPDSGAAASTWPPSTARMPRTGGATWTSYSLDTTSGALYVPGGNPAPDFAGAVRPGNNLYTGSLVVLDARTGALRTYVQLVPHDFHDWDISAPATLVRTAAGKSLAIVAGKNGMVYGIDRSQLGASGDSAPSDAVLYRTPVTTISNATAPITTSGTHFCPGTQGGVEWNNPAYSPATNMAYSGVVDWCATVTLAPPEQLTSAKLGQPWTGADPKAMFGKLDTLPMAKGWIVATGADDGQVKWKYRAEAPVLAGVTATAGGVVFGADMQGHIVGLDARTGDVKFRYDAGEPIGGGIASYASGGMQRIAVAAGMDSPTWKIRSGPSRVIVLGLP